MTPPDETREAIAELRVLADRDQYWFTGWLRLLLTEFDRISPHQKNRGCGWPDEHCDFCAEVASWPLDAEGLIAIPESTRLVNVKDSAE